MTDGLSPSSSETVAEQVSAVAVVTPVDGVTTVPETMGARFKTIAVVLSEAEAPFPSSTEAAQVTTSSGMAPTAAKSSVDPLPTTDEPMDHSYAGVSVSSGSVTTTEQVRVMSLVTLLAGAMAKPLKVGGILSMVMLASPAKPSAMPSVGVTRTVQCSFLRVAEDGRVLEVNAD